jgi:hypothetical protein
MANKQINQYAAAGSIDPANDQFLIDPGGTGAYLKINRNTILGITGSPIGTTDTQNITNKTLNNTNSITVLDSTFTIQDNSDNTKQAQFQLSGNTTGTTRVYSLPNATDTLAGIATAQTFTNKTLTAPTISGGTIDNATITVDAISGHSTSTIVTVANLQISNGVLNSANAVTAVSIANGAIQPQALVTGTGTSWAWSSWTPTWTNLTVGNGTVTANFIQIGKTIIGRIKMVFGSTSSISGDVGFTAPVAGLSVYSSSPASGNVGVVRLINVGTGAFFGNIAFGDGSNTVLKLNAQSTNATYAGDATLSSTIPFTWTNGSIFFGTFTYETA